VRTRIKICGCTSVEDAELALDAGADAVGVLLAEASPRRISMHALHRIAAALPALIPLVAVFVDPPSGLVDEALKVGATPQFHGFEDAESCEHFAAGPYLKAYHLRADHPVTPAEFAAFARPYAHATWLFDTAGADGRSGGTGRTFDWTLARELAGDRRFAISGGLTPENVGDCVRAVRPYAVDVRSGVETDGRKDPDKVRAFVRAVRAADASAADALFSR
jgi:phosphoribosylanthranilate isomerase